MGNGTYNEVVHGAQVTPRDEIRGEGMNYLVPMVVESTNRGERAFPAVRALHDHRNEVVHAFPTDLVSWGDLGPVHDLIVCPVSHSSTPPSHPQVARHLRPGRRRPPGRPAPPGP